MTWSFIIFGLMFLGLGLAWYEAIRAWLDEQGSPSWEKLFARKDYR